MSKQNDGGPAFPIPIISQNSSTGETTSWQTEGGMTIRDYFAAKAMQGMCADPNFMPNEYVVVTEMAYEMADAMLKAREE